MRIDIILPANRNLPGWLRLLDAQGNLLFACPCLGKADNAMAAAKGNPTRNPLLPFGDTPLGQWEGRISARPMSNTRTYGIHRVIDLHATGGDALRAQNNKRDGIWIHGGAARMGRLRPTYGCIRVADEHMGALLEILDKHLAAWVPVETRAV